MGRVFFPYCARLSFSRIPPVHWKSSASGAEPIGVKARIVLLDTKPPKGSMKHERRLEVEGNGCGWINVKLCRSGGFHVALTPHPLAGL